MKKLFLIPSLLTLFLSVNLLFAGGRYTLFTAAGKDYYKDSQTNLLWTKEYAENKTWKEALKYCEELDYAGFTDWRLPNVNELADLIHTNKYNPATDLPNTPSEGFWSSSSLANTASTAWDVGFNYGYVFVGSKGYSYSVRCVRRP